MFGVFIAGTVAAVLVPLLLLRRDLERQQQRRDPDYRFDHRGQLGPRRQS